MKDLVASSGRNTDYLVFFSSNKEKGGLCVHSGVPQGHGEDMLASVETATSISPSLV